jgi:ATP-binding cassette subfamily B protein
VRVVRAYRQEPFEIDRFRARNAEYVARNPHADSAAGVYYPSMGLLMGIGALLVLWLGGREVIGGRMTLGELVAFNSYLTMLAWPMIAFGWVTNLLQRGTASWKRMLEVLDAVPGDRRPRRDRVGVADPWRHRASPLTFPTATRVLHDRHAAIPAGTTTAIVGATGSGKVDAAVAVAAASRCARGDVFVDGVDVQPIPLSVLRGAIGFVPQEPFLFSARSPTTSPSACRRPPMTHRWRASVAEAAAVARLDKDVADFPHGYDTVVGERGSRCRASEAARGDRRALAIEPKILILGRRAVRRRTLHREEILHRLRG